MVDCQQPRREPGRQMEEIPGRPAAVEGHRREATAGAATKACGDDGKQS